MNKSKFKTRACPHCNYKYTVKDYYTKLLFSGISSKWKCKNCESQLTLSFQRRLLVSILISLSFLVIIITWGTLSFESIWKVFYIIIAALIIAMIPLLDQFKLVESKQ